MSNSFRVGDDWAPPLIPSGLYTLRMLEWRTVKYLGRVPKLVLRLSICDPGPHFEEILERWYNVKSLLGPPRQSGLFVPGWSSDLYRDYLLIAGRPPRRDRLSLSKLKTVLLLGEVQTVTTDRIQRQLHPVQQYSVVRRLSRAAT